MRAESKRWSKCIEEERKKATRNTILAGAKGEVSRRKG